jgi:hypothetical protein
MTNKQYWVSKRTDGSWAVKKSNGSKASSLHKTQLSAWKEARRLAKGSGSEAYLKGADGQIKTRNSYGNDLYPLKG